MKTFGKVAGYKIYIQKSIELLSNDKHLVRKIGKKYLGIDFIRKVYDL